VYPVIAEPPSAGEIQLIVRLVDEIFVVGAAGTLGFNGIGNTAPLPERE
jgi:hypothetical protein